MQSIDHSLTQKKYRSSCITGLTIGIDVGGTNTDAVLYDNLNRKIAADVKIPTMHADYEQSIDNAVKSLLETFNVQGAEIASLNISTTLSTNALLEGKVAPVNLVLIGFSRYPHLISDIKAVIKPAGLINIRGGHTGWGKEKEALDNKTLETFARDHKGELFAISSMYSSRNPEHEMAARNIVISEGCAGVTCGHELAHSRLNAVKRTITAYLNSALMPLTEKLICGIENVAKKYDLTCPLMFLRSDSSLVSSDWCRRFPLETIFSGPAASVRGAQILVDLGPDASMTVVDMGGTSTDIGNVEKGRAVFSEEGATVGFYRTMIPSLDIRTIALGGDSLVKTDSDGNVLIGPERALPLCRAAETECIKYEGLNGEFLEKVSHEQEELHFILLTSRIFGCDLSQPVLDLVRFISNRLITRQEAFVHMTSLGLTFNEVEDTLNSARRKGIIVDCAYTPTDAVEALGFARVGDHRISLTASNLLAEPLGINGDAFAKKVQIGVSILLEAAISAAERKTEKKIRVYVGTPIKAFVPNFTDNDCALCIFPDKGSVASAVGAATSSLELSCSVSILHSFSDETYTAFLPQITLHSNKLEELLKESETHIRKYISDQAEAMGYRNVEVNIEREFVYLDKFKSLSALSSIVLTCDAVVHNA